MVPRCDGFVHVVFDVVGAGEACQEKKHTGQPGCVWGFLQYGHTCSYTQPQGCQLPLLLPTSPPLDEWGDQRRQPPVISLPHVEQPTWYTSNLSSIISLVYHYPLHFSPLYLLPPPFPLVKYFVETWLSIAPIRPWTVWAV